MKTLIRTMFALILAGGGFWGSGCETESANENNVRITPPAATIRKGEAIEFTATGGYTYRWSIADAAIGFLSNADGAVTVYTSLQAPVTNETLIQTLTVTSTIEGSASGSSTNSAGAFTQSADVRITHVE